MGNEISLHGVLATMDLLLQSNSTIIFMMI